MEGGGLTFQVKGFAAVLPEFVEEKTQNRRRRPAGLPVRRALVVQDDRVRFTPPEDLFLILVVGNDSPDRNVPLLEPPEHEPRYDQVYGGLYVGRLVQLMGATVQQEQRSGPGLQLLLEPLHAFTRRRIRHVGLGSLQTLTYIREPTSQPRQGGGGARRPAGARRTDFLLPASISRSGPRIRG